MSIAGTIAVLQEQHARARARHLPTRTLSHKMKLLRAIQLTEAPMANSWEFWTISKARDLKNDAADIQFYARRAKWDEPSTIIASLSEAKDALNEAMKVVDGLLSELTEAEQLEAAE